MTRLIVSIRVLVSLAWHILAVDCKNCGKMYPASFMKYGTTAQRTLSYGAPVAPFTISEPLIAGCAPATAYYSTGQKIAQIDLSYAEGSPDVPLITAAVSNDSDVGSFFIKYERSQPGSALPLRIRNMTVVLSADDGGDPGRNFARFSYDGLGRLVSINWTYTGPAMAHFAKANTAQKSPSPLQRLQGTLPKVPTQGYELFAYEDAAHPDFVTYYRSDAVPDATEGPDAERYTWVTNDGGLVTDTTLLSYEPAKCPGSPCEAGSSCCRNVGADQNQTGTCYAVSSCDKLGGTTWHYKYTGDGRAISMNESGTLQQYTYDDAGRLVGFHEGNKTFFIGNYSEDTGSVNFLVYFVMYPIFPEVFSFAPPAQVDNLKVLVV